MVTCAITMIVVLLLSGCGAPAGIRATPAERMTDTPAPTAEAITATATPAPPSPTPLPSETIRPTATPTARATQTVPPSPAPSVTPTAGLSATASPFSPRAEVLAENVEIPWGLAFAPDGRILFTERPGRLRLIDEGQLQPEPLAVLTSDIPGEGGLMGLALDPAFAETNYLYVMYTYQQDTRLFNRISRLILRNNRAVEEVFLLDQIPGARFHNGGRLAFGPDGTLYATTGDAGDPGLAQNIDSLAGKILRLNADGSLPEDNPFPGSYVHSYGHRNPQGLAWHPETGQLFSSEHGPTGEMGLCCRDEVNLIIAGGNYGWPVVTLPANDPRFIDPILSSGAADTWAPASAAIYEGELLAAWRGDLFFGALRGQHVHRVVLGNSDGTQVRHSEELFRGEYGRIRTVVVGPDGALWFTTSNRDGRGRPSPDDDRILRIIPS